MADTPLGKGLIEIGANLAPLERGLAEAQAKTRRALGGGIGGAAGSMPDVAGDRASAAKTSSKAPTQNIVTEIASETSAMNQAAIAQDNLSAAAARTSTQKLGLAKSLSNATAGFRGTIGAITGTIGAISGIGTIAMTAYGGLQFLWNALDLGGEKAKAAADQITAMQVALTELRKTAEGGLDAILGIGGSETENKVKMVEEFYRKLQAAESEAASYEFKRIEKSKQSEEEKAKSIAKVNDALKAKSAENEAKMNADVQKVYNEKIKKDIEDVNQYEAETAIRAAQAAGDERKVIDLKAAEDTRKLNQQIADTDNEFQKERLGKRLAVIEAERQAAHKDLDEKAQAEKDAQQKIADEKKRQDEEVARNAERAAKAFADAQRASFSQLQNQINGLFNTGNMEVGIGRVASLVQVLIDKTERG